MTYKHARLLTIPGPRSLSGARLEEISQLGTGRRRDVLVDYMELRHQSTPQLTLREGRPQEAFEAVFIPRRLRLKSVQDLALEGLYRDLNQVPEDHPVRDLRGVLFFRATSGLNYFILFPGGAPAGLQADPEYCLEEERVGEARHVAVVRNWSPAPPSPPRLVPTPEALHRRFGGNPVAVHLGNRVYKRRLFVGDVSMQGHDRPEVDAVLNLGEKAPDWFTHGGSLPDDRWAEQGEGILGMGLAEITFEANWVIERLRQGKRVLVHCLAGMNRSAAVCCAVLVQLEGLSAGTALERVRQHHPWAHPDAYHWILLRWMAKYKTG